MNNMDYCDGHIQLIADIASIKKTTENLDKRINGSIDDIKEHIKNGGSWRTGIVGVAVLVIIDMLIVASMWGRLNRTVEVNTDRISHLETIHPRSVDK